jgi:hypothetical protein
LRIDHAGEAELIEPRREFSRAVRCMRVKIPAAIGALRE